MNNIYSALPKAYSTLDGKPLVGRVMFRDPISSNLLDTYSFSRTAGYIPATNPRFTDVYGQIQDTWTLNKMVQVFLYSYIGDYSDMTVDEREESWHFEYSMYVGFDNINEETKNVYNGISGLKNAPVEEGIVLVKGYNTSIDCEPRYYIWDPNATDNDDGGIVISSNLEENGKWILVWNQESLPNEIYGVTTADYSNIDKFLSYPNTVGSSHIATPRQIEFTAVKLPNNYSNRLSTTKSVKCSRDCFFGKSVFTVNDLEVIGNGESAGALGNFKFTSVKNNNTVMLSWYNSAQYFFGSNARTLIYDSIDNLTQNKVTSDTTISNCELIFLRDWSTQLSAKLTMDNVKLQMKPEWWIGKGNCYYVYLKNMDVDIRNFEGLIVSHCDKCTINLFKPIYSSDNIPRDGLCHDSETKTNNVIKAYSEALVKPASDVRTDVQGGEYFDTAWLDYIATNSLWGSMIFHGSINANVHMSYANLANCDFSDCHSINFDGCDFKSFNIPLGRIPDNFEIRNATGMRMMGQQTRTPVTKTLTFKNCKDCVYRFGTAGRFLNVQMIDSTFVFNDGDGRRLSAKNLYLQNSALIDNFSVDPENYPLYFTTEESLEAHDSHFKIRSFYKVSGDLVLDNCTLNYDKPSEDAYNQGQFIGLKNIKVSGCDLNLMHIIFNSDPSDDNMYDFTFTGNKLLTSLAIVQRDKCHGTFVGNTMGNAACGISIPNSYTAKNYCVEGNANYGRTTKLATKVMPSIVGGWCVLGQYGMNLTRTNEAAFMKGRAQEIYCWVVNNYFFYPTKGKDSYEVWLDKFIAEGNVSVSEHWEPFTGGDPSSKPGTVAHMSIKVFVTISMV